MKDDIRRLIENEFAAKRAIAREEKDKRSIELAEQVPNYAETCDEIFTLGLKMAKSRLAGCDPLVLNSYANSIHELSVKKRDLIVNAGYSEDYADDVFACNLCNDTGTVFINGKAENCVCYKNRLVELMQTESCIGTNNDFCFEGFDDSRFCDYVDVQKFGIDISPKENINRIKNSMIEYCNEKIDVPGEKSVLFTGQVGTGKSFMSKCMGHLLIDMQYNVFYISAPEMFDVLNKSKDWNDSFSQYKVSMIKDADFLIIDDLGTENISDAKLSSLLSLINYRSDNDRSKRKISKTLISTNIPAENLAQMYDDSIASRIWGNFYMYRFAGNDLRLTK